MFKRTPDVIYLNTSLHLSQASNSSFIINFIMTTKSVVNVIVPAVISRNIGMICDKFNDIILALIGLL